ncbi:protein-tyrosine phosphatase family protein [Ramlibacter algicola]|uniref:Tyrosine-protein phosphatase n=1 Tax=Ramlibacter algicola TaxID=2795217 RepID=A0A934UT72_9BURK|nr:tyrosine-protein phosphatase [Ramlibacter algicola]MBK0394237.1 tyrosine-protein phosphatase [Ramlibacter algicola]
MPLRSVPLPPAVPGRLWLASMPGRFEPWSTFLAEASRLRIDEVVCLTPRDEIATLSPRYHAAVATGELPFRWRQVPVPNFGVPPDREAFRQEVRQVASSLAAGESVLLHCAAGMGRTGSAAVCVLKALGLGTDDALQRVRDAGSNPQGAQQSGLVEWF